MSKIKAGRVPHAVLLEKLLLAYPSINAEWLLTGKGEMFIGFPNGENRKRSRKENVHPTVHPTVHPIHKNDDTIRVVTVDNKGRNNIVMLDASATAGWPENINNPQFFKDKPAFSMPGYQFQHGDYICVQVQGDSMYPTIYHQDYLIAERLINPAGHIRDGYIYLLVSKEGVTAKRLLDRLDQRSKVVCQSDNQGYPTFEVPGEDILEIWQVKARLSFNLTNPNATLRSEFNDIKAEVAEMRSEIRLLNKK